MQNQSLGQKDPQEEEIATHSSVLNWKIPWTEKPGGLQSMELQRVRHDWTTEDAHLQFSIYGLPLKDPAYIPGIPVISLLYAD